MTASHPAATHCDLCGRDVSTEPHQRIRCGDPDCRGCMIGCLACDQKDWDGDLWRQKAVERPVVRDYDDWMERDDVCQKCGEYGSMKHGDPDDCRSVDCMGDRVDAAMDAMEDR